MPKKLLSVVLGIDALLSIGFGLASYIHPRSTYGTIVDLAGASDGSLVFGALAGLSVFYVVIGAACLCAAFTPWPYAAWVAGVMVARHAWIGITGFRDVDVEWIIGNPWPDIVIHAAFVVAYSALVVWQRYGR